ncbi:hypothetical protein H7H78_13335 [Mycobacterium shinjukuense]|uniref:Uncharacterized protein n=1 Tax=Mycobacterium shinjukuense TaxID=398694 RepID=A0A7I7MUG5_9MYCO|nr:alpha/beta hydrolase [Mycobacterium shinjukuense]MCV6986377.1 hypothetical protein [Mycobacterium shinjukuense]ORB62837.1 hypothetical protein BST45_18440 [Mycobacterium shinjukuense]BBX75590.1 hypothetical protein MSHI_34960 [Mycobacterium shinjukuense]
MRLRHISVPLLIGEAGGDPWAINNSLQAGRPAQISDLAQAFYDAGRCTTEASAAFDQARRRFEAAWNRENGDHPINDSAEVQRVAKSMGLQAVQLPRIAVDLETIAAALAQAQRSASGQIATLEAKLQRLDDEIGEALELEKNPHLTAADRSALDALISALEQQAIDDTKAAVGQLQSIRNGYSDILQDSLITLRIDGYDPAVIDALDAAQSPAESPIRPPLSQPLPEDPRRFAELWNRLTPAEKDWLYSQDHYIGNHDGMPAADRDHYNRLTLADELARAQTAAAQADALRAQHPDWAAGENIPHPNEPGAIFDDRLAYEAWQRRYDDARGRANSLPDLRAVDRAITGNPERRLLLLDTKNGRQARAAIAVGDPDTATHVSVTAPGLNTTVHGSIASMTEEATNLRTEALRQLSVTPGHEHDTVSAIAWIGYDAPQIPGWDDLGKSLAGGWDVSHDDLAQAGAQNLARFYDGLGAAHQGTPAHLTAIGHSYGSLTTGLALQEPGNHGVSDALFYGSPGIEAATPRQLQLGPGHVYAMETPDDPIQWTYDGKTLVHSLPSGLAQILGFGADATGTGDFGPNPATNPHFTRLATGPATVSDGHGGTLNLEGAHGHSDYPRPGSNNLPRTTGYNIAAVVAGLGDQAIRGQ